MLKIVTLYFGSSGTFLNSKEISWTCSKPKKLRLASALLLLCTNMKMESISVGASFDDMENKNFFWIYFQILWKTKTRIYCQIKKVFFRQNLHFTFFARQNLFSGRVTRCFNSQKVPEIRPRDIAITRDTYRIIFCKYLSYSGIFEPAWIDQI